MLIVYNYIRGVDGFYERGKTSVDFEPYENEFPYSAELPILRIDDDLLDEELLDTGVLWDKCTLKDFLS